VLAQDVAQALQNEGVHLGADVRRQCQRQLGLDQDADHA